MRDTGKVLFITLRQGISTVQAVLLKSTNADMLKWASKLPRESVVDVTGALTAPERRVESVTQGGVELSIATLFVVSKASPILPFNLEDASRSDRLVDERLEEIAAAEAAGMPAPAPYVTVSQDLRLDARWIDLRTPANQAIFRLSSAVCTLFREFLLERDFVEIQTPKIQGGASEGGSQGALGRGGEGHSSRPW